MGQQCTELFHGIKSFLMAENTKHTKLKDMVAIPTCSFTKRAQQEMLFPSLKVVTAPATPQRTKVNTLLNILAQKDAWPTSVTAVPDPETECVKIFVMCTTDLHHILKLCGLIPGQEELVLPPWIKEMAVKQLTKDGKHGIIHEMCTQLWYEDNPIPLFPAIYKMVQDKIFRY